MNICIEIVVLNDDRIFKALESLRHQTLTPDRILIADGGSKESFINEIKGKYLDLPLDVQILEGKPAESRYKSLNLLNEDITVFLDSDQYAPESWLELITEPLIRGDNKLAYTGGPTKPYKEPKSSIEIYLSLIEEHIYYNEIKRNPTYVPLGNTAWRTTVLKYHGFDRRLKFEAEDNDLETRTYKSGYFGMYVEEAWVWHDKTIEKNLIKLFKKRYKYLVGAATVFLKNETLSRRGSEKRGFIPHQFAIVELMMKPIALLHALSRWHIVIKHQEI